MIPSRNRFAGTAQTRSPPSQRDQLSSSWERRGSDNLLSGGITARFDSSTSVGSEYSYEFAASGTRRTPADLQHKRAESGQYLQYLSERKAGSRLRSFGNLSLHSNKSLTNYNYQNNHETGASSAMISARSFRSQRENELGHQEKSATMASRSPKKSGHAEDECDKCGQKNHLTKNCPHFRKDRESHPDGQQKKILNVGQDSEIVFLENAMERRMPGDGNCLFHSLSHLLNDGTNASVLRKEIASFIRKNPTLEIADVPLKDWILWDSGSTVQSYTSRMAIRGWGGGIECAACSRLKGVNVHIYEEQGSKFGRFRGSKKFKRISAFDLPGPAGKTAKTINVLYRGGVHYNALEVR